MEFIHYHPEFITATILDWQPLLMDDRNKDIILESLNFMVRDGRIILYAYVIMSNHIHLIWQVKEQNKCIDVRRDFFKYTAHQLKKTMTVAQLKNYRSTQADRKIQIWKRNTLYVELYSERFFLQKLDYIHHNPVKAGLCRYEEEYLYSSARFYRQGGDAYGMLRHYR